ncbi:L-threonylcarbamoyladenylate synthase [Candidatus Soleaferrea massiliensis]|uniref:L-threonylcarbamoyladenylate synthase n=1 Tax=Candidatus Soleaferrea massiliensis TaxID=1470354 RepID=UPI00058CD11C|nr:L-threonylcarbamoyladenylate synthase [Candidatus Soleaferrea massiliensis]
MHTKLLTTSEQDLREAGAILRGGGLVAIPTETVYGLAANALDERAVRSIFEAKGRPQDNPLIVHVCDTAMIPALAAGVPDAVRSLAERFWPGPLTVIMPKSDKVPSATSGGLDTVAIRFPSDETARKIIAYAGVPLAAPSANLSGSPSPTTAQHCIDDMTGRIDAIVCGEDCKVGVESTVITLAENPPRLLRPGAVTLEMLREVLPDIVLDAAVKHRLKPGAVAASPGMKYKHYAPKAKVVILDGSFEQFAAYVGEHRQTDAYGLVFRGEEQCLDLPCVSYGSETDSLSQAKGLFGALRRLDELGAKQVFARMPSKTGVGLAVYNRLIRAAGFDVIKL